MDSELADDHDDGEHVPIALDSNAERKKSLSMDPSDLALTDSFNGDLHHQLPLPDPLASYHANISAEIERSIANNQVLVDEIASLRDAHAATEHTRELLQRELLGSSERVQALTKDIASLEAEKKKNEDLAARMAQELQALHVEKMDLQAENANIASETKCLDVMLAETKEKSSVLARDVDEKQAAMAATQARIHMICFEVEKLQLEKEEYSNEVSLLEASNGAIDSQVSQLRVEEKALSNEVNQAVAAKALAEQNVSNVQASIAALNVQISTLTESDQDVKSKLCEAKERLRHLEEQDKGMALSANDMETCIVDLESKMHTMKAIFCTTEQPLEQEKEVSLRAPEVMHMEAAASGRDLHVLEASSHAKQQYVQNLQCQVSEAHEEKEALAHLNEELKAKLRSAQEEPEAEQLRKDIKRLEGTLKEAEESTHLLDSKEAELRCKLQELTVIAKGKPSLADLASPLVISGGTVVALGLLVYLLRSNFKSK